MSREIFDKVTVIIPTFNRYPYLFRLLNFYKSYNFPTKILILDSSTNVLPQDRFREFLLNSRIVYQRINAGFAEKISSGLNNISTPYSLICADDDFIVPSGIKTCVSFLENKPDFVSAHGMGIAVYLKDAEGGKQQFYCELSNNHPSIIFEDERDRLISLFKDYTPTFYGVYNTGFLKMAFEEIAKYTKIYLFVEILLSMLTAIYGKIEFLDVLYIVRQKLNDSSGAKSKTMGELIKDGTYGAAYDNFKECLSAHLRKKSGLNIEEAKKIIDDGMSVYLSKCADKHLLKNQLIRKIKNILESRMPLWVYENIREFYRKLFLSELKRLEDVKSFSNTHFSKYYEEIDNIHKYLSSYQISEKNDPINIKNK